MAETTYTSLRENLASIMDRVVNDREVVIIRRKGDQKIAMIPADELSGLRGKASFKGMISQPVSYAFEYAFE